MTASSFVLAGLLPLVVSSTPGCSCAASSCCKNGTPSSLLSVIDSHPHCLFSESLWDAGVISSDALCSDKPICNAMTTAAAFKSKCWSNTTFTSWLRPGVKLVRTNSFGPYMSLQKGTCPDLLDNGCVAFGAPLNFMRASGDVDLHEQVCMDMRQEFTTNRTGNLNLQVVQRCASAMAQNNAENVQDHVEVLMEWSSTYTEGLCTSDINDIGISKIEITPSQWKSGPEGAQYACLDVLAPISDMTTAIDALRVVFLNVGNLPCTGVINPLSGSYASSTVWWT